MTKENVGANDYTMNIAKANIYAFLLSIPIIFGYSFFYMSLYDMNGFGINVGGLAVSFPFFLISIVAGILIHEFIHAVSWWWLDDISWSNIHFGFKWSMLTPYVHCPEPIEISNYRWGVAMPGIVLGIIPFLLALLFGNGWLFGFALIFTLAAGGDIIMLWLLRKVSPGSLVKDHPDLMGCKVLSSKE